MNQFELYFKLGLHHIADLSAYDHILFIITLCTIYTFRHFKNLIVLITAFTIGHSFTLALAAYKIVVIEPNLIEFLIPISILLTAVYNLFRLNNLNQMKNLNLNYFLALIFGLIHGLGFSNYFLNLLGKEADIVMPLFSFNIGLEIGQLIILLVYMFFLTLAQNVLNIKQRDWVIFLSGISFGLSFIMALEKAFWF